MTKTIVGLEITEQSVRAVEVSVGRTPTLLAAGEVPLPPGAARDSEVLDPDAVAVAIRQLWSRAGISGKRVVLGIGSRRVLVREYSTQAMKPELLRQSLPFQVQDLLPVPVSEAVLDFYPFAEADGQVHGLLVAAVAETIETLIATLAKAKLAVDIVDLVPFGLARVSQRLGRPGEATAMVHIGDHTSYVVVSVDGIPRFVRIIPIDIPTAAVRARADAASLLPAPAPELVLTGAGTAPGTTAPSAGPVGGRSLLRTQAESTPSVGDFAARLRSTLSFYGNRPGAARVTTVCVSGAGVAAKGMRGELARVLDVPPQAVTAYGILPTTVAGEPSTDLDLNLVSTIGLTLGEVTR
ncbi:type IV pilus biogenesis protein PilM [Microbacterium sp.]|jgi:type IV pilus assembly protein PilM|uniref:type IV pilus biogenesis protein PilM n=1 Tax=Microbacterium sp. TaxID=51671 RepID=UPI0037C793D6